VRISLVNPPHDEHLLGYGVKRKTKYGYHPPIGLAYIASPLEEAGNQVQIIDGVALQMTTADVVRQIRLFKTDVVGITAMTTNFKYAVTMAKAIRAEFDGVPVIMGGAHANYFAKQILEEHDCFDIVVHGECDFHLPEIFELAHYPERYDQLQGCVFKDKHGDIVFTEPGPPVSKLDDVLPPAWHLLDVSKYLNLPGMNRRLPYFVLMTSRGCPWGKCTFCYESARKAHRYRRHSPERVVFEIRWLMEVHGIKEIFFWDDVFFFNHKWMNRLYDLIEEEKLDFTWAASGRVDYMEYDFLRRGRDLGLWNVFLGVESGNQDLLDVIKKGTTLDRVREVVSWTKELGIESRCSFLFGIPGETPAKAAKTIQFARELDPTYPIFYSAYPYRGTELYEVAIREGRFLNREYRGMSRITYLPKGYKSPKELDRIIRKAYYTLYLRPSYIWKQLERLKYFKDVRIYWEGLKYFFGLSGRD
jgi:radical SAM superfamily enzyme YgiQ (UPF0313 family)